MATYLGTGKISGFRIVDNVEYMKALGYLNKIGIILNLVGIIPIFT